MDTSDGELQLAADIIYGRRKPDPTFYAYGYADFGAGKAFHEGPKDSEVAGLSWRMGWNAHALEAHG